MARRDNTLVPVPYSGFRPCTDSGNAPRDGSFRNGNGSACNCCMGSVCAYFGKIKEQRHRNRKIGGRRMTLLITVFAAVISTLVWYVSEKARNMKISLLMYMFWGASLMWLVDAVVEYLEAGVEFFVPSAQDMLNDGFLGLSVTALALTVWVIYLLIKDPLHTIRGRNSKNNGV